MISKMFLQGLGAGMWFIGLISVLGLFALVSYAICCLFAYAFGEDSDVDGAAAGSDRKDGAAAGKAQSWEEIEARYAEERHG